MQTAARIAKEVNISTCYLNYRFAEILHQSIYTSNPVPRLESQVNCLSSLDLKFRLQGITFKDTNSFKNEYQTLYPESSANERTIKNLKLLEK